MDGRETGFTGGAPSEHERLLLRRAASFAEIGQFAEAVADYRSAARLNPYGSQLAQEGLRAAWRALQMAQRRASLYEVLEVSPDSTAEELRRRTARPRSSGTLTGMRARTPRNKWRPTPSSKSLPQRGPSRRRRAARHTMRICEAAREEIDSWDPRGRSADRMKMYVSRTTSDEALIGICVCLVEHAV